MLKQSFFYKEMKMIKNQQQRQQQKQTKENK